MGGRGSSSGKSSGGKTGISKAEAQSQLSSLKAPKMWQSVRVTYNGLTGSISRVRPGYVYKSQSNTMFSVNVVDSSGNRVFTTNRRGSSAFRAAKEDLKLILGL